MFFPARAFIPVIVHFLTIAVVLKIHTDTDPIIIPGLGSSLSQIFCYFQTTLHIFLFSQFLKFFKLGHPPNFCPWISFYFIFILDNPLEIFVPFTPPNISLHSSIQLPGNPKSVSEFIL